jgi:hypothetical protein
MVTVRMVDPTSRGCRLVALRFGPLPRPTQRKRLRESQTRCPRCRYIREAATAWLMVATTKGKLTDFAPNDNSGALSCAPPNPVSVLRGVDLRRVSRPRARVEL